MVDSARILAVRMGSRGSGETRLLAKIFEHPTTAEEIACDGRFGVTVRQGCSIVGCGFRGSQCVPASALGVDSL